MSYSSSRSASTLLSMYRDHKDEITSPGAGIDISLAVKDMLHIGISTADLYDPDYIKSVGVEELVIKAKEDPENLTLSEVNCLANTLGSKLFIHFIERQLDEGQANAWDIGVGHALEVRQKLTGLFKLAEILTDNPLEVKIIGQVS